MSGAVNQGTALPDQSFINDISRRMLAPGGPRSVKYYLLSKGSSPATTIHYVAQHADVSRLLRDPIQTLSLGHYDSLMRAIPGGLSFMVGEHDGQKERWQMLGAALDIAPRLDRTDTHIIESIAARAAQEAIDRFKQNPGGEFNAVKDYGFLIPYQVAQAVTGLHPPTRITPSLWLLTWMRNRKDSWGKKRSKTDKTVLKGPMHGAMQYLMWAHLIFGHSFQNYGLRNNGLKFAATFAAKRFIRQCVKCSRANLPADEPPPCGDSLISRFHQIRPAFVDNGRMSAEIFDRNVTSLLVEMMGSIQLLVGISFSNILHVIYEKGMNWTQVASILDSPNAESFLDELMRLRPTTPSLFRTALKPDNDLQIAKGDVICFLTGAAGRDPKAFPEPHQAICPFAHARPPRRRRTDYLNFGPNELEPYSLLADGTRSLDPGAAHPCFGQHWARAIISAMLKGLAAEDAGGSTISLVKTPFTGVDDFLSIPDSLMLRFENKSGGAL